MNKKKLFSLAVCAIMIAILSFSTLAWFSDSDSVTNDFQVSGGDNADKIFSIDVMEAVDGDGDGDYDYTGADKTVGIAGDPNSDGTFTYENIAPGDMLYKRPITKNTGSYEQYLRMKVTFNNADDLLTMLANYGISPLNMLWNADGNAITAQNNEKYLLIQDTDTWTYDGNPIVDTVNDTVTYTFYYNDTLDIGESAVLFTWVNIPYQLPQHDMALFENGQFQIVVTGEAIQVKNIVANNAQEAFQIVTATQTIG